MHTILDKIKLILKLFISCLIGLEVSLKPNPYITELIFLMIIYTIIEYNIPEKSIQIITKLYKLLNIN
jgi:hypothetical protein